MAISGLIAEIRIPRDGLFQVVVATSQRQQDAATVSAQSRATERRDRPRLTHLVRRVEAYARLADVNLSSALRLCSASTLGQSTCAPLWPRRRIAAFLLFIVAMVDKNRSPDPGVDN